MANSNLKTKMHACATGGNFFYYKRKQHKREFFNMVRVKTEKHVSEVRTKWETNVRNLDFGQKMEIYFFYLCDFATGGIFLFMQT